MYRNAKYKYMICRDAGPRANIKTVLEIIRISFS